MLFPTLSFAAFFAVVLPVSWLLMPKRVRWRLFMVGASWFFYGAADWRFVPLLAGSTVVNHYFARRIHRATGRARHTWTVTAVATNLVVLAWFKYIGFLSLSAQSSLRFFGMHAHVPLPEVLLPIGISFFTFQALSYVIDVSRGKVRPVSLLEFAVYLSFFPHLIAGPIVRASEFLPQIREKIGPRNVDVGKAFWLISLGLFKKVVISSYLGTYAADPLFGFPRQHAGIEALFGVYAYAIQIYMDFSGYTDIAIGLALLLGIKFPQNFNAPYAAASLQDFWRRWHMTLSRWLRDYLYIPLGGNRRGRIRTYVNVMITMLLGGLWHGAAWTFVAWGALHGLGLAVERWRGERHREPVGAVPADDAGHSGKREAQVASQPEPPVSPPPPVGSSVRRPKVVTLARDEVTANARVPSAPNGSDSPSEPETERAAPVNGSPPSEASAPSESQPEAAEPEVVDAVMSGGALWDAVVSGRILSRWRTPRASSPPEESEPVPVANGGPSATSSAFDTDRSVWAAVNAPPTGSAPTSVDAPAPRGRFPRGRSAPPPPDVAPPLPVEPGAGSSVPSAPAGAASGGVPVARGSGGTAPPAPAGAASVVPVARGSGGSVPSAPAGAASGVPVGRGSGGSVPSAPAEGASGGVPVARGSGSSVPSAPADAATAALPVAGGSGGLVSPAPAGATNTGVPVAGGSGSSVSPASAAAASVGVPVGPRSGSSVPSAPADATSGVPVGPGSDRSALPLVAGAARAPALTVGVGSGPPGGAATGASPGSARAARPSTSAAPPGSASVPSPASPARPATPETGESVVPASTSRSGRAMAWPALSPRARLWVGRLITFHLVCLAWIFFRATSFHNAVEVLSRIASLGGHHRPFNWKVAAVIVGALAFQLGPRGVGAALQAFFSRRSFWVQALILAAVLTLIDLFGPAGVAPFIYFRF